MAAAVVYGGELFLISGALPDLSAAASVFIYHPGRDEWRRGVDIPTPRQEAAAGVLGGRIYVASGYGRTGQVDVLERYTP